LYEEKNSGLSKSFPRQLYSDIKQLIDEARKFTALSVNSVLSMLYWDIGNKINSEILKNDRAEYGKGVITTLSKKLETDYGSSFSEKNIRRMVQFAQVFPQKKIVVSLIRQLSWTHHGDFMGSTTDPARQRGVTGRGRGERLLWESLTT
jgi:hypothetical protein